MPGICQYAGKEIAAVAQRAYESGVQAVLLFGIPKSKDEQARGAYAENGVVQNAVRQIKKQAPDLTVITDVCLCEYTSHGHCGVTRRDGEHFHVLNDESVELIAKTCGVTRRCRSGYGCAKRHDGRPDRRRPQQRSTRQVSTRPGS